MGMRVAALCSGGKDSSLALWLAMKQGHEVAHIVAMIPRRADSWMFHFSNVRLIDLFADCVGLPLIKAETSGEREVELEDLKRVLQTLDIEGVVSGAIASSYQKSRIDRICEELGLKSITPLWGRVPLELLRELIAAGFEAIVTSVSAEGFDESWLGRKLDEAAVCDLLELNRRYKVNLIGEGGEYESLVLYAPFFNKRIEPVEIEHVWRGTNGYLIIKQAKLVEK
jgi:ABC transporter with metal-binding/Fe-S-binding domain ATP-binding protein